MIIGTYNGANIIALPSDYFPNCVGPSAIEIVSNNLVAVSTNPFSGQQQVFSWGNAYWSGTVSLPPMNKQNYAYWNAFILQCQGQTNVFSLGDPTTALPQGSGLGTPVVNGAGQTGFSLNTSGWTASQYGLLLTGDSLQIGYRLYRVLQNVNSDSSGNAVIQIFPNLRDQPAANTSIQISNCKGLFRLAKNDNKFSINPGSYGSSGFEIREAL